MVACAICGTVTKRFVHCLPQRRGEAGQPFLKALYFQDKFFGGNDEEYCSAQCSTEGYLATLKSHAALSPA